MADLKISQLTGATTPLAGTEVLPIVQNGATKQVSVANLTAGRAVSAASVTASTGNFVVGTAGAGLDFSADPSAPGMTSELLDDYEEGTWTPAVTSNSGTATTYDTLTGKYTKIGNVVYISGSLRPTNGTFGDGTSFCSISGLPFSAGSSLPRGTVSGLDQSNYAANQYGIGDASSTSIYFILAAGISQNSAFSFSGFYIL